MALHNQVVSNSEVKFLWEWGLCLSEKCCPISLFLSNFIAYYDGKKGDVCDDASHVIRDQSECTKALKALGYPSTGTYWTGFYSGIPKGCSIRDNTPHFEKSTTGIGTGRDDLTPICKGSRSSGKLRKPGNSF